MRLAYHPLVQRDVSEILRHYDRISPRLGDEFWAELIRLVELVSRLLLNVPVYVMHKYLSGAWAPGLGGEVIHRRLRRLPYSFW